MTDHNQVATKITGTPDIIEAKKSWDKTSLTMFSKMSRSQSMHVTPLSPGHQNISTGEIRWAEENEKYLRWDIIYKVDSARHKIFFRDSSFGSTGDIPQSSTLRLHAKLEQPQSQPPRSSQGSILRLSTRLEAGEARTAFNEDQVSRDIIVWTP